MSNGHEKRAAPRFQVLGHAQLKAGPLLTNCIIRDVSASGVKLGIARGAKLPPKADFWLIQGDTRMRVVVKWRDGDHMGVAFTEGQAPVKGARAAEPAAFVLDA